MYVQVIGSRPGCPPVACFPAATDASLPMSSLSCDSERILSPLPFSTSPPTCPLCCYGNIFNKFTVIINSLDTALYTFLQHCLGAAAQ